MKSFLGIFVILAIYLIIQSTIESTFWVRGFIILIPTMCFIFIAYKKTWWAFLFIFLIGIIHEIEKYNQYISRILLDIISKNNIRHFEENIQFGFWLSFIVLVIILLIKMPKDLDMTSHGTASWGDNSKFNFKGLGVFIGKNKRGGKSLKINGKGHLITIAPTRSGKGVSAIIPNLLTYDGSIICIDPKGENTKITAKRREELNDNVFVIDPWNVAKSEFKASFNPIEFLQYGDDLAEDVAFIADALVYDPPDQVGDAHWNEEARAFIGGLLMYVVKEFPQEKNLNKLRELLTLNEIDTNGLLRTMQGSNFNLIERCANRMLSKSEKEFSGVLSTTQRHTQFLDSPRIQKNTATSSFSIEDLIEKKISVFLVIPPDKINAFNRWLRIVLTNLIMGVTKSEAKPSKDIMFFIDEFAAIGKFQIIQTAMGLMAGYGMKFWLFLQDLSQLKALYGKSYATFLSNSSVFQVFGVNDFETAKFVSDSIGNTTIETKSISTKSLIDKDSQSFSTTGRNLINSDEIMNLNKDLQIIIYDGKPYLIRKIQYYSDLYFRKFLKK